MNIRYIHPSRSSRSRQAGEAHEIRDSLRRLLRSERAFTMIEIALCIAIVAFAMVAIVGVLPTGMTVQRDNREDTVINQEGQYWLEALRGGNRGLSELTNYVEQLTITNSKNQQFVFGLGTPNPLTNGDMIVGLLSKPKIETIGGVDVTNKITARVKALTGVASEKGPLSNEFSFRYELQVESVANFTVPESIRNALVKDAINTNSPTYKQSQSEVLRLGNLARNQQEIRLTMRWPLYERGNGWITGLNRRSFRATVSGRALADTNIYKGVLAYHFRQNNFLVNAAP
jgi:type II secretory pathway pseudopilin PulG